MSEHTVNATICNKVEQNNNYNNDTQIHVTAWTLSSKIHYRFIDIDVTWSQALDICETMKYGQLSNALPGWVKQIDVRNYLEGMNYRNINYTMWMRAFRPHLHVRKWYSETTPCVESPYVKNIDNYYDGQCAAIRRNESEFFKETVVVQNCNQHNPFVCIQHLGCIELLAFAGFDATETPTGAKLSYLYNMSSEICQIKCTNDTHCNSFTYSNTSGSCKFISRQYGYGALNYTIYENKTSDITHYVKTGSVIEYIDNATDISIPNVSADLPDCGIDDLPPGYCSCENIKKNTTEKMDDIVTEIVQNLTIDKKETSAYKRKVSSSTDKRGVSKAFGILGLLLITGILSLFVIADVANFTNKSSRKAKKKKRNDSQLKEVNPQIDKYILITLSSSV
jgi:competence protein ComGC